MIDAFLKMDLENFIKQNYIETELEYSLKRKCCASTVGCECKTIKQVDDFIDLVKDKQTFSQYLLELIDKSGETDAKIYNKAGIDRRLFSKIRSNVDYQPSKNTIFALAMALELDGTQTAKLLNKAGYDFSKNKLTDIILMFCIENKIYDLYQIDTLLEEYNQKPIASIS